VGNRKELTVEGTKEQSRIEYYMHLPYSILLHEVEDNGEKYWIADIPELPGCRSHGSSVEGAVKSVGEAKKDWILDSLEQGEEVPVPVERDKFSGKTMLRMSRSLHRSLSLMAESEKLSLNQLIVTILATEVGRFNVLNRLENKIDNLLNRIDDVLDDQSRLSFLSTLIQHYQTRQRLVVGTSPGIEAQIAGIPVFLHAPLSGAVSTTSPLEDILGTQYSSWRSIYTSMEEKKKEDVVEVEDK
jgi:antitoxin HicB